MDNCKNRLNIDYTARVAIDDLKISIEAASRECGIQRDKNYRESNHNVKRYF